jgi:hypothetical protein
MLAEVTGFSPLSSDPLDLFLRHERHNGLAGGPHVDGHPAPDRGLYPKLMERRQGLDDHPVEVARHGDADGLVGQVQEPLQVGARKGPKIIAPRREQLTRARAQEVALGRQVLLDEAGGFEGIEEPERSCLVEADIAADLGQPGRLIVAGDEKENGERPLDRQRLSDAQAKANRNRSKIRALVEHVFAALWLFVDDMPALVLGRDHALVLARPAIDENLAFLHHQLNARPLLEDANVLQGIAIDEDEIGELAGFDGPELLVEL